jgi:hypothetical protein
MSETGTLEREAEAIETAEATETIDDFFAKAGPLPAAFDDVRRHPRFYFRSCAEATIYPFGRQRDERRCFLLTRDLSRGGVGLIHREQLFPGQQMQITLNEHPPRYAEVMWCRRLSSDSYLCGCRFVPEIEAAVAIAPQQEAGR